MIAFNDDELLVGEAAKENSLRAPNSTISNVRRLIGRKFTDEDV